MPTSPRASLIGLPTLRASSVASLPAFCSTAVASRRRALARSRGVIARHAGYAALARANGSSASSTPASGTSAMTFSVAGSITFNMRVTAKQYPPTCQSPDSARGYSHSRHLVESGAPKLTPGSKLVLRFCPEDGPYDTEQDPHPSSRIRGGRIDALRRSDRRHGTGEIDADTGQRRPVRRHHAGPQVQRGPRS